MKIIIDNMLKEIEFYENNCISNSLLTTIKNRINVLNNLEAYGVEEKHREKLSKNLLFFIKKYKNSQKVKSI